jgi:hypothetical protein
VFHVDFVHLGKSHPAQLFTAMPPETSDTTSQAPFPLTAIDRDVLSMSDDDFRPPTWEDLKQIIGVYLMYNYEKGQDDP